MLRPGAIIALFLCLSGCSLGERGEASRAIARVLDAADRGDRAAFEAGVDRAALRADLADQMADLGKTHGLDIAEAPTEFVLDRLVNPAAVRQAALRTAPGWPARPTAEQIVPAEPEAEPEPSALDFASFVEEVTEPSVTDDAELVAAFVDPEDISFEPEDEEVVLAAPPPPPEPVRMPPPIQARPAPPPQPVPERPVAVMVPERPAPRERPTAAQASPMPDPTLSRDIAEELLEPATNAAVRANLSKLSKLGIGNPGLTIEAMMRDMLRPMLKEWLDENLPTVVERMVEKEIARISRGVE